MSEILSTRYTLAEASQYNARHVPRRIDEIRGLEPLVVEFPGLLGAPSSREFAEATRDLQTELFDDAIDIDGKFGPGTLRAAQDKYHTDPDDDEPAIIVHGRRVPVVCDTPIETWRDPGGLDLHHDGGYSRRSRKPDLIVLHWGGRNARSCRNALAGRHLSSHFGTDRGVIHQWLDLRHSAWHAGSPANGRSVGIDICQQPTVNLKSYYKDRGYGLRTMANPSSRGPRKVLSLHKDTAKATADLVAALCEALGIPATMPDHDRVMNRAELNAFRGVVGHHHLSKSKWDVAPWVPALRKLWGW